ncbi:TPA: hypothetical protein L5U90_003205 [Pseudomonas aeruginosa]|nr:hypothetical protein [Pseudomonas aeruginosa]
MSVQDAKKDRVVFRSSPSFYAAIAQQADVANRSVNGEICTAVYSWLYERDTMVFMKDRLMASASVDWINLIRKATPSYLTVVDEEGDTCKTNVRFKESVETDLRAAWEDHKRQIGAISLNSFLKLIVSWWLMYSFQMRECAKALHRDFNNSMMPPIRSSAVFQTPVYGNLALA